MKNKLTFYMNKIRLSLGGKLISILLTIALLWQGVVFACPYDFNPLRKIPGHAGDRNLRNVFFASGREPRHGRVGSTSLRPKAYADRSNPGGESVKSKDLTPLAPPQIHPGRMSESDILPPKAAEEKGTGLGSPSEPSPKTPKTKTKRARGNQQATMEMAEDVAVRKGFFNRHFVKYFRAHERFINPDSKDTVVGYGCAGADVSGLYFRTNFRRAYFMDQVGVNAAELKGHLKRWEPINKDDRYFTMKRSQGYSPSEVTCGRVEFLIIQELQGMGIDGRRRGSNIKIFDINESDEKDREEDGYERGCVRLKFRLPGDKKWRKIVFINKDITEIKGDRGFNEMMHAKLNCYCENATVNAASNYSNYLGYVAEWLKPEGFMMLNPYDGYDRCYNPLSELPSDRFGFYYEESIGKGVEKLSGRILDIEEVWRDYGWRICLIQEGAELLAQGKTQRGSPAKELSRAVVSVERLHKLLEHTVLNSMKIWISDPDKLIMATTAICKLCRGLGTPRKASQSIHRLRLGVERTHPDIVRNWIGEAFGVYKKELGYRFIVSQTRQRRQRGQVSTINELIQNQI